MSPREPWSPRNHSYRAKKKPKPKPKPDVRKGRRILRHEQIHRHLWERRDRRGRLPVDIGDLAAATGHSYDLTNRAVIDMRREGRIRAIGWKHPRTRVYEVSDPATWDPDDLSTHRPPPAIPAWG